MPPSSFRRNRPPARFIPSCNSPTAAVLQLEIFTSEPIGNRRVSSAQHRMAPLTRLSIPNWTETLRLWQSNWTGRLSFPARLERSIKSLVPTSRGSIRTDRSTGHSTRANRRRNSPIKFTAGQMASWCSPKPMAPIPGAWSLTGFACGLPLNCRLDRRSRPCGKRAR